MKFRILNPWTWLKCMACGKMQKIYGIHTGIQPLVCHTCDDWVDHIVHHYEGDIVEVKPNAND